ncbi:hypothetical protein HK097_001719 [Rhizophlyctis rosea]|uniref:Uncharacterized protein n=1 Tax=Rhizophlyctis rosea TaxID=64517 RepID=A0AAD5WYS5_9FUNG|nr:hypothetical protein HK097_001719 [Rhizophlyctis rosea]
MAGGNPFEPYDVFGLKVPRYKMAAYGIVGYTILITGVVIKKKMAPKTPITFDSPEEEAWVKKYITFRKAELHKPLLVQQKFEHPTGLY